MLIRRRVLTALVAAIAAPAWAHEEVVFGVGQVWTLRPPMDASARIRIGRIEDGGRTVHISLWGQPIPADPNFPVGSPLVAGHLPITAAALRASVDRLTDETPPDGLDFEGGYETWREARGGVFSITVPEIVDTMLQAARHGQATTK